MKVLKIDLKENKSEVLNIENQNISGYLDLSIYLYLLYENQDPIIFFPSLYRYKWNGGALFKSPITNSLIFDSIGELGHYIKSAGFDAIIILNKSDKKYFLFIVNDNVIFLEDEIEDNIYKKIENNDNLLKNYYGNSDFISFYISIGSVYTIYGNLYSIREINSKKIIHSIRYGLGSKFYEKNITGISIGGDNKIYYDTLEKLDININENNILKTYKDNKYNLPYFNYQNIYLNKEEFDKFYEYMILDNFLKQNIEKYHYSILHGLGPFLGIFDIKFIEELNEEIIKYGLDPIYLSYILASIAEAYYKDRININNIEKPDFDIKNYRNIDYEKNYNFYKNMIENISSGELTILGKNIKKISEILNIKDISVYIDIGEDKDIVPEYFISYGIIFPQFLYNKEFTNYSFIYEDPKKYADICKQIFIEKYNINNIGERRLKFEDLKQTELYWIYKMYDYNYRNNYIPNFFTSKRVLDIINYVKKYFGKEFNEKEYFYLWYNEYFNF